MRKTQLDNNDMMDFDNEELNLNINSENTSMNNNQKEEYVNFHSASNNSYFIKGSYDINQMTKAEKNSLLKVKINSNIPNEFVLINSNFQLQYMALNQGGVFHINSFAKEHKERINDVCFFKNSESPFDKAFISASSDGTMKIWDSRAAASVKTIAAPSNKKVFSIETNSEVLAAGMEREIGIWDLKMMKQMHKSKFAHSEDVTFVKMRNNFLMTGGEDQIINIFDFSIGLGMEAVVATANIGQPLASLDFLDDDINFVQAITTVHTYHIFNMFTGVSQFEFDAKNENYKSDYILEGYFDNIHKKVNLFCGNHYGDIILFNLDINNKEANLNLDSIVNSNVIQSFNSIDRLPKNDNCYIVVSDEGILTLIDKKTETERNKDLVNELKILEDQPDDYSDNTNDTMKGDQSSNTKKINNFGSINNNRNTFNGKKKTISSLNKFSPY